MTTSPKFTGNTGGRPASAEIKAGMMFGHLKIIQSVKTKQGRRWITECTATLRDGSLCRKRERVPTAYILRKPNPKTHCGCQSYIGANEFPREKGIWQMMHQRTENPDHVSYAHYGGRGIKVCLEWNRSNPDGWKNFIAYMGGAPTKTHSIDRVNPNLGYQPFQEDGVTRQCRWATSREQANNKRPKL